MKISLVSHLAGQKGGHYTDYANKICESLFRQNIDFQLFVAKGYKEKYFKDNNKHPPFEINELKINSSTSFFKRLFRVANFYLKSISLSKKRPIVFFDSLPPPFELFLLPFVMFVRSSINDLYFVLHRNPFSKQSTIPRKIYYGILSFIVYLLSKKNVNFFVHVKDMISQMKFFGGNFHYINYGVSASPSLPVKDEKGNVFNLLFFGGIVPSKGIINLIRAVKLVEKYKVSLTIAGKVSDEFKNDIMAEIATSKNIDIRLGYLPEAEIPVLFSKHDCLVLPYKKGWNATSGPLHQAIQFNTPVIVTEVPQLSYIVDKYNIGLVSQGFNFFDLSKAILNMKYNHLFYSSSINAARKDLSYDNLAKTMYNLVEESYEKAR